MNQIGVCGIFRRLFTLVLFVVVTDLHPEGLLGARAGTQRIGLNGHGIQLRLRLGVICPYMRSPYTYFSKFTVECKLPLFGVCRYYWGPYLHVDGTVSCSWKFDGRGANRPSFSFLLVEDRLEYFRSGGADGSLVMCPVEVIVEPRFGPCPDSQLVYAQLCWVGTISPAPLTAYVPSMWEG